MNTRHEFQSLLDGLVKSTHNVPKYITKEVRSESTYLVSFHILFFFCIFRLVLIRVKYFQFALRSFIWLLFVFVIMVFIIFLASTRPSSSLDGICNKWLTTGEFHFRVEWWKWVDAESKVPLNAYTGVGYWIEWGYCALFRFITCIVISTNTLTLLFIWSIFRLSVIQVFFLVGQFKLNPVIKIAAFDNIADTHRNRTLNRGTHYAWRQRFCVLFQVGSKFDVPWFSWFSIISTRQQLISHNILIYSSNRTKITPKPVARHEQSLSNLFSAWNANWTQECNIL